MTIQIYPDVALLATQRMIKPPRTFWTDLLYRGRYLSDEETIQYESITEFEKLAPYVVPSHEGKPMYDSASEIREFSPASIVLKDGVRARDMKNRHAGIDSLISPTTQSAVSRSGAIVTKMLMQQKHGIGRTIELMNANIVEDAAVTFSGEDYPTTTVDFRRLPALTQVLTGNETFDNDDVNPMDVIQDITYKMFDADFGGVATAVIGGWRAVKALVNNPYIVKLMDRNKHLINPVSLQQGLLLGNPYQVVGYLRPDLPLIQYRDSYQDVEFVNGKAKVVRKDYWPAHKIALVGPNFNGIICRAPILSFKSGLRAWETWTTMYDSPDGKNRFVKTETAPISIPMGINASACITAVAEDYE